MNHSEQDLEFGDHGIIDGIGAIWDGRILSDKGVIFI